MPFLRDELATKPQDLELADAQPAARKSLAARLRAGLRKLKNQKK